MLGLPNQSIEVLEDSLDKVIKIEPEHISVYSLILEEGTKLEEMVNNHDIQMIDEEIERKMYWKVKLELEKNGYIQYEISNFSKPGYMSKHNLDCWNQKEYIGVGAASHSYISAIRYSNETSIEKYIKNTKNKIIHERQTKEDMRKRIYDIST